MRWVSKDNSIASDSLVEELERVMGAVIVKEQNASTSFCLFSSVGLEMLFEPLQGNLAVSPAIR